MENPGTYTPNLTQEQETIVAQFSDPIVLAIAEALHLERDNIACRIAELRKNYQGLLSQNTELRDDLIELESLIKNGEFAVELGQ